MADRPDKRRRKELLDQLRAAQRAASRAALPVPDAQMQALFDMLDHELPRHGCDHTLRLTRHWLVAQNLDDESVVRWLRDHGGFCDCEALANAEQCWRDAIHDVDP